MIPENHFIGFILNEIATYLKENQVMRVKLFDIDSLPVDVGLILLLR